MALVRIDYVRPKRAEFVQTIARQVEAVMANVLNVPSAENYVICQGHDATHVCHAPGDCGPERLVETVFIQITLNQGRTPELKARFFERLNTTLAQTGLLKPENIFVNLVEVAHENWSFGRAS